MILGVMVIVVNLKALLFDMLENDVISILDELNIEKAHFVGLSIGGMTSLGLALKHQNRFNKIVLCRKS